MKAIRFETELTGNQTLTIPPEAAAQLPPKGRVTVLVRVGTDADDDEWRKAAYECFMRDDSEEDSVYDKYS